MIRRQYARLLQEQFRRLGVAVEITELDNNVMNQRLETGNFDAALMSRQADPSPSSSVALVWIAGGASNYAHYDNPVFAEAYARATGAATREAALRGWRAVFQVLIDDAPGIWLYSQQAVAAVHRRVADVRLRPDAPYALVRTWRIPADRLIDRDRVERR